MRNFKSVDRPKECKDYCFSFDCGDLGTIVFEAHENYNGNYNDEKNKYDYFPSGRMSFLLDLRGMKQSGNDVTMISNNGIEAELGEGWSSIETPEGYRAYNEFSFNI